MVRQLIGVAIMKKNKIVVNNHVFEGRSVSVKNGRVYVDGVDQCVEIDTSKGLSITNKGGESFGSLISRIKKYFKNKRQ